MKKIFSLIFALALLGVTAAEARFNTGKALSGLVGLFQAATISDGQMAAYVSQSIAYMDSSNTVLPESSPYVKRLRRLTDGITDADGIPLNFKVYKTDQVNAFACPDGSVRVFSGIMDRMDDDELLGIIGHEIGHVIKRHSRNAFRNQLLTGALKDIVASTGGMAEALTESQLVTLGQALGSASYSRKQENEADDCGYDFLVAHGKNPWGMVRAFEKLQSLEESSGATVGAMQKMFSSHPDTKKRIGRMTQRCVKDGYRRDSAPARTAVGKSAAPPDTKAGTKPVRHAPKTYKEIHF